MSCMVYRYCDIITYLPKQTSHVNTPHYVKNPSCLH